MVCPQVVDLLFKDAAPKVFAEKFHDFELIFEAGRIPRESFDKTLTHLKSQIFKLGDAVRYKDTFFINSTA